MLKTIQDETGRTVKMGRRRPVARGLKLSLGNYLMQSAPAPPPTVNYQKMAPAALGEMYGNDTLGDCVIAGPAHVVGVLTGNAREGAPSAGNLFGEFIFTMPQIVALYSAIGGYNPDAPLVNGQNPTDNGCDEETMINYWENHGFPAGHNRIVGAISVNPSKPVEYRQALWLFENLIFGVELPDAWVNPFPSRSGFVWDKQGPPDPENGHCFVGVGYGPEGGEGIDIDSWAMIGKITDAAIEYYAASENGGQLFSVISMEGIRKASKKAPSGFDWSQLVADFDSLGGKVAA